MNSHAPKVSVIVLCYNSADTLAQALDSVLTQRCDFKFEIVAGDDGSQDGTSEILRTYAQMHPGVVRPLIFKKNRGVQANYFDCLEACRGEYIADCAADDYWDSAQRLQLLCDALDSSPQAVMSFSQWTYFDIASGCTRPGIPVFTRDTATGEFTLPLLTGYGAPAVHLSAAVFRKEALMADYMTARDSIYRNPTFGCEDLQVLVALAEAGGAVYVPQSTLVYRVGGASITSEHNHAKAARFALGTLQLKSVLAQRTGHSGCADLVAPMAEAYHYALSHALMSCDSRVWDEAVGLWNLLPHKSMKSRILRACAALPGGAKAIRTIKNLRKNGI